jgi:hypothetical protein
MKTHYKIIILFISLLISNGCTVTEKSQRTFKFSFQAGPNKGGITENTDLNIVPNVKPADEARTDAYSGATRTGLNNCPVSVLYESTTGTSRIRSFIS